MTPPTELPSLNPPSRLLAGPGPSNVEPRVLEAMQKPMLGHLDPDLHDILTELVGFQRQVYKADGGLVFPHQATGSSGMECGLQNLLEPGDTAIVAVTGFFGNRIARMAERTGAKVVELKADYGQTVPNDQLLDAIDANPDARLVAVVHAETSTGVRHPSRSSAASSSAATATPCSSSTASPRSARTTCSSTSGASTTPTPAPRRRSPRLPECRRSRSPTARSSASP